MYGSRILQIFINRLFYKGLCLTVPPTFYFLFVLFFLYLISVCFTCSCIYVSRGFILFFFWGGGGGFWTSYMLTDCLPSNCKKTIRLKNTYLLTSLTQMYHHTHLCLQISLISCGKSFLERDLPKYRWLLGNITHNAEIECTPPPIYSLLLSSVFSRQQGLLGGAESFFSQ